MLGHRGKVVAACELQAKRVEDKKEKKKITKGKILPLNVWIYSRTLGWNLLRYEYVGDDELIYRWIFDELMTTRNGYPCLRKEFASWFRCWTCYDWFNV